MFISYCYHLLSNIYVDVSNAAQHTMLNNIFDISIYCFQTFGDEKYLQAAEECAEVVWRRGLLKKGYGLCHGVAGNAYSLLAMYKESGNERHLYRALKVRIF